MDEEKILETLFNCKYLIDLFQKFELGDVDSGEAELEDKEFSGKLKWTENSSDEDGGEVIIWVDEDDRFYLEIFYNHIENYSELYEIIGINE